MPFGSRPPETYPYQSQLLCLTPAASELWTKLSCRPCRVSGQFWHTHTVFYGGTHPQFSMPRGPAEQLLMPRHGSYCPASSDLSNILYAQGNTCSDTRSAWLLACPGAGESAVLCRHTQDNPCPLWPSVPSSPPCMHAACRKSCNVPRYCTDIIPPAICSCICIAIVTDTRLSVPSIQLNNVPVQLRCNCHPDLRE